MDTILVYRNIIKQIILRYAQLKPSHGNIRLDPVFDEANDRYALMQVGWDRQRRVRGNLIYLTIQKDRVFIEYDGTENGITDELVAEGIPRDNIILAFHQLV
jgi:XisI protein